MSPEGSVLHSQEVDDILVLCEEVMRATPEGAHRFIEPAPGVLSRAKSKQHNIVFGRRGSGKSSLLRKMAADLTVDRRPIAFVDMETFKGHSYPDVLISVLIKSLKEFEQWLNSAATNPATKTSFWKKLFGTKPSRPPFGKKETAALALRLQSLISSLEEQLRKPEQSENETKEEKISQGKIEGSLKTEGNAGALKLASEINASASNAHNRSLTTKYTSHKIEYLHQNILKFQQFFLDLSTLSDGSSFLVLDDLYHIRKSDQASVIDYFHRIAKGNGLWLKIGTIKHRSQWYQHSDPPLGVKLGDDAKEINLDISLEKFETLKEFLKKVLSNIISEKAQFQIRDLVNPTALDRLIIASGGVTRDFVGIFSNSISIARNRGAKHHRGTKVGAEDINAAAGEYDGNKREEFKLDTAEDRAELENAFQRLVTFCTEQSKCNIFLISQKTTGPIKDAVDQLIDLRLIHPVKSRVTLKKGAAGELYEAYMLDVSQYTASRKVHDFHMIDLSSSSKDEDIRRSSLIFIEK
ncbi:MAG: hypothetical protein ACYC03_13585 [Acidovorax defluvii]